MRLTDSKPPKFPSAWRLLFNWLLRRPAGGDDLPNDPPAERQSARLLDPLDRIRDYLGRRGLDRQVRVNREPTGRGFVLEDDDGYVHAIDYDAAVAVIERIWLYQP